jgi:hypothetical protein
VFIITFALFTIKAPSTNAAIRSKLGARLNKVRAATLTTRAVANSPIFECTNGFAIGSASRPAGLDKTSLVVTTSPIWATRRRFAAAAVWSANAGIPVFNTSIAAIIVLPIFISSPKQIRIFRSLIAKTFAFL